MSLKTFTYTKANGVASTRVVQVVRVANKNELAVDLSELNDEEQVSFAVAFKDLREDFDAKLRQLMQEYDVANNFRLFDPEKMTNVVVEEII